MAKQGRQAPALLPTRVQNSPLDVLQTPHVLPLDAGDLGRANVGGRALPHRLQCLRQVLLLHTQAACTVQVFLHRFVCFHEEVRGGGRQYGLWQGGGLQGADRRWAKQRDCGWDGLVGGGKGLPYREAVA